MSGAQDRAGQSAVASAIIAAEGRARSGRSDAEFRSGRINVYAMTGACVRAGGLPDEQDRTTNKAWFLVLPVLVLVAFSAVIPLMTVVNYSFRTRSATTSSSGRAPSGSASAADRTACGMRWAAT
jgi:hypothetical protein